jgi:hypothetical protein
MNAHLDRYLVEQFPKLYAQRGADMKQTGMCWGFQCGDGWFGVIYRLSKKLEPLGVEASCVKEKYGGLSFYLAAGNDEAWDLIDKAEDEAFRTCEFCGAPGRMTVRHNWYTTLCAECLEEHGGERFEPPTLNAYAVGTVDD